MTDSKPDYINEDLGQSDLLTQRFLTGLFPVEPGEEVWIPVTLVRGNNFRAVKVEVKERASAGNYEEENAIEDWEGDIERLYGGRQ